MLTRKHANGGRKKKIRVAAFIRCGELCKSCSRRRCEYEPTKEQPVQVPCIDCEGSGLDGKTPCEACDGTGFFDVAKCPKDYVGHRVSVASNSLAYLDKGILPDAGGLGDQSAWLVATWDALQADCQRIEEEKRRK